jgi:hypothetical protein
MNKRLPATWLRVLQGLGLFFALLIVLPWLGGKIVPGRESQAPPAGKAALTPPAASTGSQPAAPQPPPAQPAAGPASIAPAAPPQPFMPPEALAKLPAWQQQLLGDKGWLQPHGTPAAASAVPGQLRASVIPTLPRLPGGQAYQAQSTNINDTRGCMVRLRVVISGGKSDAQGRYKYCNWAFGDGLTAADGTAFTDDTLELNHFFVGKAQQEQQYIIRVQVVDAAGAIAYGDSLPIVVR